MNKRLIFLAAGLAAYGAIVIDADPWQLFFYVVAGLLLLVAPCFLLALVLFPFAVTTRRSLRLPVLLLGGGGAVAGLMALALPMNEGIQEIAVASAKGYPDRVAPLLEEYRRQHGVYPASLDEVPARPRIPRLMRDPFGYRSDGRQYYFSFPQPGG